MISVKNLDITRVNGTKLRLYVRGNTRIKIKYSYTDFPDTHNYDRQIVLTEVNVARHLKTCPKYLEIKKTLEVKAEHKITFKVAKKIVPAWKTSPKLR